MKILFTKMHGAGNDFIVIDDREQSFPLDDVAFIQRITTRCTGVGSDGIILIQPSKSADLRMRFFNPDGSEVGLCGNGARCFARRAFQLGAAPKTMTIQTQSGVVHAKVLENQVRLILPDPTDFRLDLNAGIVWSVDFVYTGVEHAVVRVDDLDALDVPLLGRRLRHHELFAPRGTNANFMKVEADGTLSLRTYERGVEAETLACGTGAVAAALVAARHGWVDLPIAVHCAGGYDLTIDSNTDGTTLTGDAVCVFEGEINYGDRL